MLFGLGSRRACARDKQPRDCDVARRVLAGGCNVAVLKGPFSAVSPQKIEKHSESFTIRHDLFVCALPNLNVVHFSRSETDRAQFLKRFVDCYLSCG